MDFMLVLKLAVVFGSIFLGLRLGGIAAGYAGGLGAVVLGFCLGMTPGSIPFDVILIIMSLVAAVSAVQLAGGLDFLVAVSYRILLSRPKYINFLAPSLAYFLTLFAGTGHTVFSLLPVIVEVSKRQNIKPSVPLSLSLVASQTAITASPISAAVIYMTNVLEPMGWSYPVLIAVWVSSTYTASMLTALIVTLFWDLDLSRDRVYLRRLAHGQVTRPGHIALHEVKKGAKLSIVIFSLAVFFVIFYAAAVSKSEDGGFFIHNTAFGRDAATMSIMLTAAAAIVIFCKVKTDHIMETPVFKSGMAACVCILGVAWLGNTFIKGYADELGNIVSHIVAAAPFLLALAYFFASAVLYSQAVTAKLVTPLVLTALNLGEGSDNTYILVASFAAAAALFIFPTYPTIFGAAQMDDTGTTRIGRFVFNHVFFIPGVINVALSVAFGFAVTVSLLKLGLV